jgi:hypothetical protein
MRVRIGHEQEQRILLMGYLVFIGIILLFSEHERSYPALANPTKIRINLDFLRLRFAMCAFDDSSSFSFSFSFSSFCFLRHSTSIIYRISPTCLLDISSYFSQEIDKLCRRCLQQHRKLVLSFYLDQAGNSC